MDPNFSQQERRSQDPFFDSYFQLQKHNMSKQRQHGYQQNRSGGNNNNNNSNSNSNSNYNKIAFSSFSGMNAATMGSTMPNAIAAGPFARMGSCSFSKMSNGNLSMVFSQQGGAASAFPMNGTNNQLWGNPNSMMGPPPVMNNRMNCNNFGLPTMNAAFNPAVCANNSNRNVHIISNDGIQNRARSLSMEMEMNMNMTGAIGRSFYNNSSSSNNNNNSFRNNNHTHFPRPEGFGSCGGFGGGSNPNPNAEAAAEDNNNHHGGSGSGGPNDNSLLFRDFSELTTEQLREIVLRDLLGGNRNNSGGEPTQTQRSVPVQRRASTGTTPATVAVATTGGTSTSTSTSTSMINPETLQAQTQTQAGSNSNPFLKNLGTMDYRNHILPLSLQQHSSKAKRLRTRTGSHGSNYESSDEPAVDAPVGHQQASSAAFTGLFSSSGSHHPHRAYSSSPEPTSTTSNPSFYEHKHTHAMPGEEESYIAAEHGILAPWSARAAGLFGDMMEQSNEDEKARKAARKKPKDKPKRPLSAYNIFFKEERGRILESKSGRGGDGEQKDYNNDDAAAPDAAAAFEGEVIYRDSSIDSESSGSVRSSKAATTGSQQQRGRRNKIGFESLAKLIGRRWQDLDDVSMAVYKSKAGVDMERYKREMDAYNVKHGISRKRSPKTARDGTTTTSTNSTAQRRSSCNAAIPIPPSPAAMFPIAQRRKSTGGGPDLSSSLSSSLLSAAATTATKTKAPAMGRPPPAESSFPDLKETRLHSDLFLLSDEV